MVDFDASVESALAVLRDGGVILYGSNTGWSLGCDAQNEEAINRLKVVGGEKASRLLVLLADERDILRYVAAPDPEVFDYLATVEQPTAILFDNAVNLPDALLTADGSACMWLVRDRFLRHLLKRLRGPIAFSPASLNNGAVPPALPADLVVPLMKVEAGPVQALQVVRWKNGKPHPVNFG